MIIHRIAALAIILAASPAFADNGEADGKPATATAKTDKKVCRAIAATGSHMRKRICHTQSEWAEFDKAVGNAAEQTLDRRRAQTSGGVNDFN
ncbi:hypothetical protein GGQ88_001720 [Novosphingobium hassiacum]|uniref:Uncharacterized protein n=1 Tax=Novosphingobium hassiacum TaxID=173676 RepID=A0A7W5ZWD2_9SPHN|nr:hypothetical protein [Novosphingobium hassiacum]MBB3860454.1 hypothetical protein [Novosphingobium hassiacum]